MRLALTRSLPVELTYFNRLIHPAQLRPFSHSIYEIRPGEILPRCRLLILMTLATQINCFHFPRGPSAVTPPLTFSKLSNQAFIACIRLARIIDELIYFQIVITVLP
ncbi:hypothetical protein I7I53_10370 [Histoplasma capsulatum var. duboisii H88]|uniref:Uncharacterized protein n=1 Tax=Ajellomyces capsulatus (strain H88) TaxID=544711 RepID=A0A8A1LDL8_AJEC8|nr:hypothetical protein I7I53_10370 [Histoplasma capsulatum var. duboisii H88]